MYFAGTVLTKNQNDLQKYSDVPNINTNKGTRSQNNKMSLLYIIKHKQGLYILVR